MTIDGAEKNLVMTINGAEKTCGLTLFVQPWRNLYMAWAYLSGSHLKLRRAPPYLRDVIYFRQS